VDEKKEKDPTPSKKAIPAVALGTNMAAGMIVFSFIGYKIDQKLGGRAFTLIGMFLGLLYCGYEVWKIIRNSDQ